MGRLSLLLKMFGSRNARHFLPIRKSGENRTLLVAMGLGIASVIAYKAKPQTVFAAPRNPIENIQFMGPPITDIKKLNEMENDMKTKMELLALGMQANFCKSFASIQQEEESKFTVERSPEKGSLLCYQEEEEIMEKASIEVINKEIEPSTRAVGLVASIYPKNPNIPSLHLDLIYTEESSGSEVNSSNQKVKGSLSGRVLLVPYVYNEEEFKNYHKSLKKVCDKYSRSFYKKFKALGDEDGQLGGRAVGIGGISFPGDDAAENVSLQFIESVTNAIIPLYAQFIESHKKDVYTYNDRMWQLETRGRQALHLIELHKSKNSDHQITHLPPMTKWCINPPKPGQKQELLIKVLEKPEEWA